jgi:two-component system, LytTR family, sensor kinase
VPARSPVPRPVPLLPLDEPPAVSETHAPSARNGPPRAADRMSREALGELLRSRPAWAVFVLIWLFHGASLIVYAWYNAEAHEYDNVLWVGISDTLSWLLVQLAAFAVAWTIPVEPRRPWRTMGLLLAAGLAVLLLRFWTLVALGADYPWPVGKALVILLPYHLVVWMTDVGVGYAIAYFFGRRDHEAAARRLEARLAQAQLQVLKMQIHPHFLFNTLNSVSALMHRDPDEAARTLGSLRQLLERTQAQAGVQEVPLREEMEFLSLYLDIERTRLGGRLQVATRVERGVEEARVPHLVLQLLVENSIRHGIAPRRGPGTVEIRAERRGGRLVLQVADDGRGLPPEGLKRRGGVGVANTRARLAQLYGGDHRFEIGPRPGGGVAATIEIPFAAAGAA